MRLLKFRDRCHGGITCILAAMIVSCLLNLTVSEAASAQTKSFSASDLEQLVQPIALYPDVLLGTIMQAATFPDQIADAAQMIKSKTDAQLIKDQIWDPSVKAVSSYPGILKMMNDKLGWTTDLGMAFLEQHEQLLDAVQKLRSKAKTLGNLQNTSQQKVETTVAPSGASIMMIEPTSPDVIYVPTYDPDVIYYQSVPSYSQVLSPLVSYGLGFAMGTAFADNNPDINVYYHGWGPGLWYDHDQWDHWHHNRNEWDRNHPRPLYQNQDFRKNMENQSDFRQNWEREHGGQTPEQRAKQLQNERDQHMTSPDLRHDQDADQWKQKASERGWGSDEDRPAGNHDERRDGMNERNAPESFSRADSSSAFDSIDHGSQARDFGSRGFNSRSSSDFGRGGGFGGGGFHMGGGGRGGRR